jgi:hypothetical protein
MQHKVLLCLFLLFHLYYKRMIHILWLVNIRSTFILNKNWVIQNYFKKHPCCYVIYTFIFHIPPLQFVFLIKFIFSYALCWMWFYICLHPFSKCKVWLYWCVLNNVHVTYYIQLDVPQLINMYLHLNMHSLILRVNKMIHYVFHFLLPNVINFVNNIVYTFQNHLH